MVTTATTGTATEVGITTATQITTRSSNKSDVTNLCGLHCRFQILFHFFVLLN